MKKSEKDENRPIRLFYWGWGTNNFLYDSPHRHPFWQIEIVENGEVETTFSGVKYSLFDNCIYVIPPEQPHDFRQQNSGRSYVFSFKFEISGFPAGLEAVIIHPNDFSRHICNALRNLLHKDNNNRLLSPDRQIALEYLIRDMVDYAYVYKPRPEEHESRIVQELRKMINYQGKTVNVESAAAELQCSTSFLKRHIKQEKGISAKAFIDQECMNIIRHHLDYSSQSLTRIAEMMNFPDIYAFSRFFKRSCGESPTQYKRRKKLQ
jgi:AraC family transcriptional activator of pobA